MNITKKQNLYLQTCYKRNTLEIQLSVVIITFNEERNIGRCLDSIKEVADDMVVVDSFSTDQTETICKEKGARFILNKFDGHIEQKNWAITQAKFPYVLSIDADEALSPALIQSIKEIKQNWQYDGYAMNRLTNYCGHWVRHCGWYPDTKMRLWDSRKGSWQGINPHDRYDMQPDCKTQWIKGDLLHYSYYTLHDHIKQVNYFTDISSKALFAQGKRTNLLVILFNPFFKFFRDYIIKRGFLDGYYGFVISMVSAHATFLKYAKLKSYYSKRIK
jgi:glycosyltransferase involved in cell wall biosynthesis